LALAHCSFTNEIQRQGALTLPPLTLLLDEVDHRHLYHEAVEADDHSALAADVYLWCRDTLSPGWHFRDAVCTVTISEGRAACQHRFTARLPLISFANVADMLAFRLRWL
jgi:hypothetical protein